MQDNIQERITLGQAKNQAVEFLKEKNIWTEDYEASYKKYVRLFYKWNSELDDELLKKGDGLNTTSHPRDSDSMVQEQDKKPSPSPKQKFCPQCSMVIPKTWMNHGVCGWKG
jgi:hypothetical protein